MKNIDIELPKIKQDRHKYEAGYVLAAAGSPGMSGAALLSSFSALRSGCGIVRLFHPFGMEAEMSSFAVEVIKEGIDFSSPKRIFEEEKRASSAFIGPGLGRSKEAGKLIKTLLSKLSLPCVIDADALYFLAEHPGWDLPASAVLTPHKQEMCRLLGKKYEEKNTLHAACQNYVEHKKVTLVLKGVPNMIFHPHTPALEIPRGDPGMATAGSGDVLTGIIAALLAQKMDIRSAAALGVYLHAIAGEEAAKEKTSYCMVATDIIECLPKAFKLCQQ